MKFLVPAIALFCLAGEAVSMRTMNDAQNAPMGHEDSLMRGEELYKHSRRFVRNKVRGPSLMQSHQDSDHSDSRVQSDGRRYFKTRRKSDMESDLQQTEFNSTVDSLVPKSRTNLSQLFNNPDLTVLKNLVTEKAPAVPKADEEVTEQMMKKKRLHPHGRLAGRAKASATCDSCSNGGNSGQTECPSNLENMFVCPKCRTHFVVKIHIKESKGCD